MTPGDQSKQAAIRVAATGVLHQRSTSDLHYKLGKLVETSPGRSYCGATNKTSDTNARHLEGLALGCSPVRSGLQFDPATVRRANAEWNAMDAQGKLPEGWENPHD